MTTAMAGVLERCPIGRAVLQRVRLADLTDVQLLEIVGGLASGGSAHRRSRRLLRTWGIKREAVEAEWKRRCGLC